MPLKYNNNNTISLKVFQKREREAAEYKKRFPRLK